MEQETSGQPKPAIDLNIEEILASSKEAIRQKVIQGAISAYSHDVGYFLQENIKEAVNEYFKSDVLPDLQKELVKLKPQIIQSLQESTLKTAQEIGNKLHETAVKNLDKSWELGKVVKALYE